MRNPFGRRSVTDMSLDADARTSLAATLGAGAVWQAARVAITIAIRSLSIVRTSPFPLVTWLTLNSKNDGQESMHRLTPSHWLTAAIAPC